MALQKNRNWIWDIVFLVLGISAAIFMFWKCRYGFANMDEAFYLTVPYRLAQGDGLFVKEWHLSQMSGFLIYPFMKLYLLTHSSLEGIFLSFRHIYTALQIIVSVFIYVRFRKQSHIGAGAAAIVFMLYAPFGIMALSYNSLGIMTLAAALTIMATARRAKRIQMIIAGLLFAAAVLCCPYLIAVYVLYFIASIIISAVRGRKRSREEGSIFTIRCWLFFTIGAAILAAVFAAFVLSRAGIRDILAAFPYILQDTSHESKGFVQLIVTYFTSILRISKAADLAYAVMFVLFIAALIDRKRHSHAAIYLAISTICTVVALIFMVWYGNYINFVMFPVNIMGLVCGAVCLSDDSKRLIFVFWIPAILYTMCLHATSNQEFYAISSASSVAVIPSIIMIAMCAEMILKGQTSARAFVASICTFVILAGQIATVAVMRYNAVFWGSMDSLQKEVQAEGIEKGLYLPDAAADQYEATTEIADHINKTYPGEQNLLIYADSVWMYLQCPEKRISSYSGWLLEVDGSNIQECTDKLLAYYRLNPDKIPDIIYVDSSFKDQTDQLKTAAEYNIEDYYGGYILNRADQ